MLFFKIQQMDALRKLLTTYAYNILGSLEDAKDAVQDAYLNFMEHDTAAIENKKAYLVRSVINISINLKNRQKRLRSVYPGEWLPEPIATEKADASFNQKEILSYSLMVLLEKLNAKQRAVFILKEAFNYDHDEIGAVLDISAENSRQLLSRAKTKLGAIEINNEQKVLPGNLDKYLSVIQNADMQQLEKILYEDIMVVSDGGGKAVAFRKPVKGSKDVTALLLGVYKKFYHQATFKKTTINHQPALLYYENDLLVTCQIFSLKNNKINNVYFIRNPDKLKMLQKNF